MSPTSYQAALPRVTCSSIARFLKLCATFFEAWEFGIAESKDASVQGVRLARPLNPPELGARGQFIP
ncbi:MAG: hypothetical protein F6K28_47615 [Microcoleus sp. SIO2G3]|nr:hypothetical protein [Microcoleus sp. SIO2G3]